MATSTVLFMVAGLIVVLRLWITELRPKNDMAGLITGAFMFLALVIAATAACIKVAGARDLGQWENSDPVVREWFRTLMQPDNPTVSCCGEADAYWCDDYYARDGKAYCRITDDRPDEPLKRPHIQIGTEIEIPDYKLKYDRGNPSGHSVVFVSTSLYVHCFVQNGGV